MNKNSRYYKELLQINNKIQYYQQMISLSTDSCQKMFYENLLSNEIRHFNYYQWYYQQTNNLSNQKNQDFQQSQRYFTLEELAQYDGSGGRPAYVAIDGIVYDVSLQSAWGGGTHFSLYAGKDLTTQFNGCHAGRIEILKKLPQVGVLKV